MNTQNTQKPDNANTPQNKPAGDEAVQVSPPQNEELTGPFEHSGETSRQTEEARKEEEAQKSS